MEKRPHMYPFDEYFGSEHGFSSWLHKNGFYKLSNGEDYSIGKLGSLKITVCYNEFGDEDRIWDVLIEKNGQGLDGDIQMYLNREFEVTYFRSTDNTDGKFTKKLISEVKKIEQAKKP